MPGNPPPPRDRETQRRTGQGVELPSIEQTPDSEEEVREDEHGEERIG